MSRPAATLRDVLEQVRPADRSGDAAAAAALKQAEDDAAEHRSPWFVRAMVAASAWIASLLFIAFLAGAKIVNNANGAIAVGFVVLCGAVVLRRAAARSMFLGQLALALSLAGQVMFIAGVGERTRGDGGAIAAIIVSIVLVLLYPDKTQRFLSTLVALGGAVHLIYDNRIFYGVQALAVVLAAAGGHLWFNESRLLSGENEPLLRPVAYGLIAGSLLLLIPSIVPAEFARHLGHARGWSAATAALTALLLLLELRLLAVHNGAQGGRTAVVLLLGTAALAAASFKAPGVIGALFVLVLGHYRGNRVIIGLAVLFLGVFLAAFYYNMQITLLIKSYALLASGAVLLLLRPLVVRALQPGAEGAAHE